MALPYLLIRDLHIACVTLSITLFVLRGGCGLGGVDWRRRWPVLRWLPHLNDSLLLAAGLTLMVASGQYPGPAQPWLAAKLLLLLVYVGAGRQALRPGQPRGRAAAWCLLALATVGSMVALAVTRWGS